MGVGELAHLGHHLGLDGRIALGAGRSERVDDLQDEFADLGEFRLAKAAGGAGGGAEADAGGGERRPRVEGMAFLLQVRPARSSARSASRPLTPLGRR